MEPAKTLIKKFGGVKAVCGITGISYSQVCKWRMPRDRDGTNGVIPWDSASKLMDHAKENGLEVTHEDFFPVKMEPAA